MLPINNDVEDNDSIKRDDWRAHFGRSIGQHKADLLDLEAIETDTADYTLHRVDNETIDDLATDASYDAAMDDKFLDPDHTREIERLLIVIHPGLALVGYS